jgi:Cu(I)/Ag(I) efflux system protein CusF
MKTIALMLAGLLAFGAGSAASAAAMKDMKGMAAPGARSGKGVGVIKGVDAKAGTVTIQHGPIPAVGWPGMTMAFAVKPATLLKTAKVGQTVGFDLTVGVGPPTITALRPR